MASFIVIKKDNPTEEALALYSYSEASPDD
jgi:hypothetical protein